MKHHKRPPNCSATCKTGHANVLATFRGKRRTFVVALCGNAIPHQDVLQRVVHDTLAVIQDVAENLRLLLLQLAYTGAPAATVIWISAIPRAHLSGDDLAVFRRLVNAQAEAELPRALPRLSVADYDVDGIHLSPTIYRPIRAAVEDHQVTDALLRMPPPLPRVGWIGADG